MLSGMESNRDVAGALRRAERAGAAPWCAAVVAFGVVTPAIVWYERAYAAAAARARARLG
jgi:hypothetical protein